MYFLFIEVKNLFGLKGTAPLLGFPVYVTGGNRDGKSLFIDSIKVGINGWQASEINKEDLVPDNSDKSSVTLWFYQRGRIYKLNRIFTRDSKRKVTTPKIKLFESSEEYKRDDILSLDPNEIPTFIQGIKYNEEKTIKDSIPVKEKIRSLKIYHEVCKYLFVERSIKAFERSTRDGLYEVGNLIVEEIKSLKEKSINRNNQLEKQGPIIKYRYSACEKKLQKIEENFESLIVENYWTKNTILNGFTIKNLTFQVNVEKFKEFFKTVEKVKKKFDQDFKLIKKFISSFNNYSNELVQLIKIQNILREKNNIALLQQQVKSFEIFIKYINKLKDKYQHLKLEEKGQEIEEVKDLPKLMDFEVEIKELRISNKDFKLQIAEIEKIHQHIRKFVELIKQINDIRLEFKEKIDFDSLTELREQYESYQDNVQSPSSFPVESNFIPAKIVFVRNSTYKIYVDLLDLEDDITRIDQYINIYLSEDIKSEEKKSIQKKIIDRIKQKVSLLKKCESVYLEYSLIYEKYPEYWQAIDKLLRTLNSIKDAVSKELTIKITQIQNELDSITLFPEDFQIKFSIENEFEKNFVKLKTILKNLTKSFKDKISKINEELTKIREQNSSWFNFKKGILENNTELTNEIDESLQNINGIADFSEMELENAILIRKKELKGLRDNILTTKLYFEIYKNFIFKISDWLKDRENEIIELSNKYYILKELYQDVLPFTECILLKSIIATIQTESILEDILQSIKSQTNKMYHAIFGDNRLTVEIEDISAGNFYLLDHHKKQGRISNPSGSEGPTLSFGIMYSLAKKFDLPVLLDETIDGFDTTHTNIAIDEIVKLSKNNFLQCIMVIKENKEIDDNHELYQNSLSIIMNDFNINWK
ncbi:MAG: hypothetical protein ACFFCM_05915 [Promethearchaeota archaeon]